MKRLVFALFILTCSAPAASAGGLTLSIHDGLVSIDAQDVTVRQILTEWQRVGKTRIVNAERVTGGPVSVTFEAVPEKQALDIILRSIPGYVAVPRAPLAADASLYDRILIMPTTVAVAAPRPQRPTAGYPAMQPGMFGVPGGANVTQLRGVPTPLSPGALPESPNSAELPDDAVAAAAAAGLVTVPAPTPPGAISAPLAMPGGPNQPQPAQPAPGVGAPTNPWNAPIGTPQPSLAPPQPPAPAPPPARVRPPQADR